MGGCECGGVWGVSVCGDICVVCPFVVCELCV